MKRLFAETALFLVLVFLCPACTQPSRRQVNTVLDDVESYINDRPDSALAVLEGVDSTALTTRALRARYSLLRTMALDKCYKDITVPGLLEPAAAWYGRHGSNDTKMKTLYYQGRIAQDTKDQNNAAVFYARAEEYAGKVTDMHALALLYLAEATVYNTIFNTEKEKEYREKALAVLKESQDPMFDSALGGLAFVCHSKKEWGKADSLYRHAIANSSDYPYMLAIYLSNYARMKVQQPAKDPTGTIRLLDQKRAMSGGLTPMEAGAYAYALALAGETAASESLQKQLEALTGRDRVDVLPWLKSLAAYRGNYPVAYQYLTEAHSAEEVTISETLTDSVTQALQDYYEQTSQQEQKRRLRQGLYALAAVAFMLLLLVFQLLRERQTRAERDRLFAIRAELEKDLLTQEFRIETLSDDFSSRLDQMRFLLRQERLDRFRKHGRYGYWMWMEQKGRSSDAEIIKTLRKDMQEICALEKDTGALERRLNADLDNIVVNLKADLGISNKTKEEKFLCYWLIGLKADMIAELLGISKDNVYVKAHRLESRIRALDKKEYEPLLKK